MTRKIRVSLVIMSVCLVLGGICALLRCTALGVSLWQWVRYPAQEVEWQEFTVLVPRGWVVNVYDDCGYVHLERRVRSTRRDEDGTYRPEVAGVWFWSLARREGAEHSVYLEALEHIFEDRRAREAAATRTVDGRELLLTTHDGRSEKTGQFIYVIGKFPSNGIIFEAGVPKIDWVYAILDGITWRHEVRTAQTVSDNKAFSALKEAQIPSPAKLGKRLDARHWR